MRIQDSRKPGIEWPRLPQNACDVMTERNNEGRDDNLHIELDNNSWHVLPSIIFVAD